MRIEQMNVADLVPYARNSRTHSDEQVAQVAASIREFGFTNPVLIDADNGIIAGHGRVMAAQQIGMNDIPCIRLLHLSEEQKRAYVIADNKLALNAGWDETLLAAEMKALESGGFSMDLLGFDDDEMSEFLALADVVEQPENNPDDVPDIETDAVTRQGDIWILGKHRLMCGDSTSIDAMATLMGGGHG